MSTPPTAPDDLPSHPNPKPRATRTRRPRGPTTQSADVLLSKALSYTLRHGAAREGLPLRADGYASVPSLLALSKFRKLDLTFPLLQQVVEGNDKQRYALLHEPTSSGGSGGAGEGGAKEEEGEGWFIRANQGHSLPLSSEALSLTPLLGADLPETLVHGSFYAFLPAILSSGGLARQRRTHVHLTTPSSLTSLESGSAVSGMRKDAEVVFHIDARAARDRGGLKFWRSANGVLLTEGDEAGRLSMEFVSRVEDRKGELLWKDGKLLKELPEGRRVPRGKEHVVSGGRGRGGRGGGKGGDRRKEEGAEGESGVEELKTDTTGVEGGRGGKKGGKGRRKGKAPETTEDRMGDLKIDAGDV
ncbi:KptA family-domain-containing protein [Tricharina praecox]|uniref:KptA family-domain-containing protein n=1 Tax=Tricharina praecox TaxID=43433 RepID=UPI00221E6F94|nr:KptA family-domain-containing protein [Tricharina praecox]KAI5853462.1 KptA family-domain-containing protein [Tricharina praecox]